MKEPQDRTLAEDLACPVEIDPGVDYATPDDWTWRSVGTSLPNAATFHMSHSDVSRVMVDVLGPSDSPPDGQFVVAKDIPIIIMDSLDKYWGGGVPHPLTSPWRPGSGGRRYVGGVEASAGSGPGRSIAVADAAVQLP